MDALQAQTLSELAGVPPSEEEPRIAPANDDLVEDDFVIEDVSIDGMCGVY